MDGAVDDGWTVTEQGGIPFFIHDVVVLYHADESHFADESALNEFSRLLIGGVMAQNMGDEYLGADAFAASKNALPSARLVAMGFSQRTCFSAWRQSLRICR